MSELDLAAASAALDGKPALDVLRWAAERFAPRLTFATGFGAEGCVIIDLIGRHALPIDLFTLDTGVLFPETYALWKQLEARYGITIRAVKPVQIIDRLWETDPDRCCDLRKVQPLRAELRGKDAWITAIRRDQTADRADAQLVERDRKFGLIKINPLAAWTNKDVWRHLLDHEVPYNPLHDQGYPSIGCAPCTSPVADGEDARAGRWRGSAKKECGLHALPVIQPKAAPVTLIPPHGGALVDRFVTGDGAAALTARASRLPRITLDARTAADLELIATGAASPLTGFVSRGDYAAILADSRLASGTVWPVPFTLAVDDDTRGRLSVGGLAALHDARGRLLGTIKIADLYARDPRDEWSAPGALVGGDVDVLPLPADRPLARHRLTPRELRDAIAARGWKKVAGFATDAPIDRADEHRTKLALEISDGLVIHAYAGEPGVFDGYVGLLARSYPHARTILAAFPGAPRGAGPRETLLDAILRKNYGITSLIVAPDDADVFDRFPQRDLGVAPLRLERPFHCRACDGFVSRRSCPHGPAARGAAASPRADQGFILWFTGLSGAGKSTLAGAVARQLGALRRLEVLDGDEVRTHLSKGLGFSKEDRDVNIHRIAFVARTLAQHGVGVVTAAISPYADTRAQVRALAEARGIAFVEVFVNAKLESLVARDVKGLYKKALAGEVAHFTGVTDPYEPPTAPDVEVATDVETIEESAAKIVAALRARGLVPSAPGGGAQIHALAAQEP